MANKSKTVEIFGGCVRLLPDGRAQHWGGEVACWLIGFGPYASRTALGKDEVALAEWHAATRPAGGEEGCW